MAVDQRNLFIFLYICRGFCVYRVPLPPLRGQHMVLCHPRWLPTSGLTEFAACWGGAGFEPRTTDLQSGVLPLSHLSSDQIRETSMQRLPSIADIAAELENKRQESVNSLRPMRFQLKWLMPIFTRICCSQRSWPGG